MHLQDEQESNFLHILAFHISQLSFPAEII